MRSFVRDALKSGVVSTSGRPELARALNACHDRGEVDVVLPGIYCLAGRRDDLAVRVAAVAELGPDAVVTRRAAAKAWWPEIEVGDVEVADKHIRVPAEGFAFEQRYVDPRLRVLRAGIPMTTEALTVLDLIPDIGAVAVDEALRRRVVRLEHLHEALRITPGRRGNVQRAEVLEASRSTPWSPLEREGHEVLRRAGIKGWIGNHRVVVAGRSYVLDVAIRRLKIGIEFDGYEYHEGIEAFQGDRARDAALAASGWVVVRFTSSTLHTLPEIVRDLVRVRSRKRA